MHRQVRKLKRERLASLTGIPFYGATTLTFAAAAIFAESTLVRTGCAIFSASLVYTVYRINRIDWAFDPTADCATHYRAHLIRRRDAFRSFHYWSSLPAAPGVALATLGWYLAEPSHLFDVFMPSAFWIFLQIAFWVGHGSRVASLQKEIDLLDAE
jgi:hypothetical protein